MVKNIQLLVSLLLLTVWLPAQQKATDATAPLHALQPDYPTPYIIPSTASVRSVLDRIHAYLDSVTPARFVNKVTGVEFTGNNPDSNIIFAKGDFRLTSYEWGVTYSGMLAASQATGQNQFTDYVQQRLNFIGLAAPSFSKYYEKHSSGSNPLRQVVDPKALDDAGAMCAAMIKLYSIQRNENLRPLIDRYIRFISSGQQRLKDGTLARNRPQPNTLWLDDLYMSVPALAQMGKLTGEKKYFDDAVKQVVQFSRRMFNKDLGIFMHGWVEGMNVHPEFHWARANGWALMAMTELLEVLPVDHKGYTEVLEQYRRHVSGLAPFQSGKGFWHQLLDKNDSYLETSATAIFTYCISRGINKGWIDAKAYAPLCLLGWNAISSKVNAHGQVEGTCVGTGMAFDPAFYYYRPVNVYAAHGYGPVLLAGAEIINLLNHNIFEMNDSSIQLKSKK